MKDGTGGLDGERTHKSKLDVHFFSPLFLFNLVFFCDALLSAPDFQFSKHLGFLSLLNMCQTKKKKINKKPREKLQIMHG